MKFVSVATFPINANISTLLIHLTENAVSYRVNDLGSDRVLEVPEDQAERVVRFLQNMEGGLAAEAKVGYANRHIVNVFNAWPATCILILLGVVGYLIARYDPNMVVLRWLSYVDYKLYGRVLIPLTFYESIVSNWQWWRIVTPAFLHFGLLHIVFNAMWMWTLGRRLETFLGWRAYLLMCLVIALASNSAQYLWSESALFGGLSGVVCGFVGLIAALSWRTKHPLLAMPKGLYVVMGVSIILGLTGLINKIFGIHIANLAHVGGLISGVFVGLVWPVKRGEK